MNSRKYYIKDSYIYGPKMSGRFYIQDGYIYGPSHSGQFYIQDKYIYGPRKSGRFYIQDGYIYQPTAKTRAQTEEPRVKDRDAWLWSLTITRAEFIADGALTCRHLRSTMT